MQIGQPLRKRVSQTWGLLAFRWVAVWGLLALCASYGETGTVVALATIAVIICVTGNVALFGLQLELKSNQDWVDRLTNRMFYKLFWEALKSDDRSYIDVDQLFDEASKSAAADIKKADNQSREEFGFSTSHGGTSSAPFCISSAC